MIGVGRPSSAYISNIGLQALVKDQVTLPTRMDFNQASKLTERSQAQQSRERETKEQIKLSTYNYLPPFGGDDAESSVHSTIGPDADALLVILWHPLLTRDVRLLNRDERTRWRLHD